MSQLDLFAYEEPAAAPEPKPAYKPALSHCASLAKPDDLSHAAAREPYKKGLLVNRLLHAAIDNLELAQDFIRQAQEIAIVDLEKPEQRIAFALQEIWAAYYEENNL